MALKDRTEGVQKQELWRMLLERPDFRKLRNLFAPFIKNPVWLLITVKVVRKTASVQVDPATHEIWKDPRASRRTASVHVLTQISKKRKNPLPFTVRFKRYGLMTHCIPLFANRVHFHFLALVFHQDQAPDNSGLHLLYSSLSTITTAVTQDGQLKRLSESLRPRLVALSAIHTVHRLCSITLNTDELFKKLAHLTAHVLRAKECSIFILDKTRPKPRLVERGRLGFPPAQKKRPRSVNPKQGVEGQVFTSAKRVLRKSLLCVPLIDEDVVGVILLKGKKASRGFNYLDEEILMTLAEESVIAIKNAELYEEQKKVTFETIQSLAQILGTRFGQHRKIDSETLLALTLAMTDHFRLSEDERQALHYATLLKDASKIGLPDEILKKSAKLTGEEIQVVRQHPVYGAKMIQSFKSLKPVAPIILASHENYDGTGYPYGMKGDEIPLGARILAVLNAFDAIIAGRPYKSSAGIHEVLEELRHNRGTQFDPHVVDIFQKVLDEPKIKRLLKNKLTPDPDAPSNPAGRK